ncbi:dGTPase [Saliniradius amylolyticus]|uniref:Deoxyguanosinetriphosphate triphosphohydrolase-like protein n=1 Tax=Saliniradius amylolyticus TaxID=2183582 RepID=A0A2S2E339_9ALTE|nr:anti-phage deoxyguanosine triphosphatase [Saliniradius amylolyticus]AWL12053.1 dGTPase [Saliniradius amylolyticus]
MTASPWLERRHQQTARSGDLRSPFHRDKARILHSAAFRRLQAKTQVLGVGVSDFHRTRLTHSLEAAQIGHGIGELLKRKYPELTQTLALSDDLIEALCLAHDIGHPPFGHGGETALHHKMRAYGGFEGNGQTFRIVSKLEPYSPDAGMNLCRRTLLGLVKYPALLSQLENSGPVPKRLSEASPPKGLFEDDADVFDWLLTPFSDADRARFTQTQPDDVHRRTRYKSFDCSIMELADDIAYSIHDLEDAIVMGIVLKQDFEQAVIGPIEHIGDKSLNAFLPDLSEQLFSPNHYDRKNAIGALVNAFITHTEITLTDEAFESPLLRHNAALPHAYAEALGAFKHFVFEQVICAQPVRVAEYRGQQLVMALFDALTDEPEKLLPANTRQRWIKAHKEGQNPHRVIADYISGMTDEYASSLYRSLYLPPSGRHTLI